MAPANDPYVPPTHASVVKAVTAGLGMLLVATLVAKVFFARVDRSTPPFVRWVTSLDLGRVAEIRDALPGLAAKDEPAAFMLGPSTAFYGFHPEVFDAALAEQGIAMVSYNVAALGNIAETDRLIVRRIGDAYRAAGRRPQLLMLQFGPLSVSTAFLDGRTRPHVRKKAVLSTTAELAALFFEDPHAATELATLRFFDGVAAPDSNLLLGKRLFRPRSWWPGPPGPEPSAWEQQSGRVNQNYAPYLGKFDPATRGVFNPLLGNDVAEYDKMADLAFGEAAIEEQTKYWSVPAFVDVEMAPGRLEEFVAAVGEAQAIADHVVVVIPPISELVRFSAVGRANTAMALETIRRETGAPIIDISAQARFSNADFVDFTHLRYNSGAPKFSRMLAEQLGPTLRSTDR